jgi:MazG family protein
MIMANLRDLYELVTFLRSPEGCPWDREQTNESMKGYLLEEVYEVLDAIDGNDPERIKEELGDLLFLTLMHVRIAEEEGKFTLSDLLDFTKKKMIARHPHVFGDKVFRNREELLKHWETSKGKGIFKGLTLSLPSLKLAQEVGERARSVGFDWEKREDVWQKVEEEMKELKESALKRENKKGVKEELGDLLFALSNLARHLDIDAEDSLRQTVKKFLKRFEKMEELARERGINMENLSLEEMDRLWEETKHLGL